MNDIQLIQSMLSNHKLDKSRDAAIVIPLVREDDQSLSILFEVRAMTLRSQPGEICFPGGRIDPDDVNPLAAACRELCEELGLSHNDFDVLTASALEPVMSPRRGKIYPYVCYIPKPSVISPNQAEVSTTFRVPLSYLLEHPPSEHKTSFHFEFSDDFPFHKIANQSAYKGQKQTMTEHVFEYDGHVIWGLTARLLVSFLAILNEGQDQS